MIIEFTDDFTIKWKYKDTDDWTIAEVSDLIKAYKDRRPQGEWETVKGDYFTPGGDAVLICPFCHSEESKHLGGIEFPVHWDFCPNCGANMKGGAE